MRSKQINIVYPLHLLRSTNLRLFRRLTYHWPSISHQIWGLTTVTATKSSSHWPVQFQQDFCTSRHDQSCGTTFQLHTSVFVNPCDEVMHAYLTCSTMTTMIITCTCTDLHMPTAFGLTTGIVSCLGAQKEWIWVNTTAVHHSFEVSWEIYNETATCILMS